MKQQGKQVLRRAKMKNCYMDAIDTAARTIFWQSKENTSERRNAISMFTTFISHMYDRTEKVVRFDLQVVLDNVKVEYEETWK